MTAQAPIKRSLTLPPSRAQVRRNQAETRLAHARAAVDYLKSDRPLLITTENGVLMEAPSTAVIALRPLLLGHAWIALNEAHLAFSCTVTPDRL